MEWKMEDGIIESNLHISHEHHVLTTRLDLLLTSENYSFFSKSFFTLPYRVTCYATRVTE